MRLITIVRDKKGFVGSLIKYHCFLNVNYNDFEQYFSEYHDSEKILWEVIEERFLMDSTAQMLKISNGKSIEIEIDEQQNELFVVSFTGIGVSISNLQIIKAGNSEASYRIKTDYSCVKGTKLTLYAV